MPPYPRGPTGTLRLPAAALGAQPKGRSARNFLVACLAVVLSLLGLLGTAILAVRAASPAPPTQASTLAPGVPNRMPEEDPAPPVSLSPLPADTGHVSHPSICRSPTEAPSSHRRSRRTRRRPRGRRGRDARPRA